MALTPVPYKPRRYPSIQGGEPTFFNEELARISQSITTLITAVKALEEQIAALDARVTDLEP